MNDLYKLYFSGLTWGRLRRSLLVWVPAFGMLCACGSLGVRVEAPINEPTAPSSTSEVIASYLTFPYLEADAGTFLLQPGDDILVSWEDAPEGAASYQMRYLPADGSPPITLPFGGGEGQPIQASWLVPQGVSGCLEGLAIFGGAEEVRTACARIYSEDFPRDSVCSLQVVDPMHASVHQAPDEASPRIAGAGQGVYQEVIGKSFGGWYLIEIGGLHDKHEDVNSPLGWIRAEEGARLSGPCEEIPYVEPSNPAATTIPDGGPSSEQGGGATPTAAMHVDTPSCTNEAAFLEDLTVPDGSVFSPGEVFTKAWHLKNAGTCRWTLNYGLVFFDGERMGAYADLPMPSVVEPGESVALQQQMTAPGRSGTFQGNWFLRDSQGRSFGIGSGGGSPFWVKIKVIADLATPFATTPAAGICPEMEGDTVTMTIRPDMPDPRCMSVRPDQTLRVANAGDQPLTISLGRTTTYEYDALHRLTATVDPQGNRSTTAYNPDGTVASTTDALGRTTSYAYDDLKRVIAVTDPDGGVTTTTYDAAGNVIATTDPEFRTTTYEYDALGRLIRQTEPGGGVTEHFYDETGNRVQTIDPEGGATTYAYDALNRLSSVTDALGNATSYSYDAVGNRVSVTDGNGHVTTFEYDSLDRQIATIDPLGSRSETSFDALGNVLARTDANGNTTSSSYDALNRLVAQTNALSGSTTFTYDAVGNQVTVTDANGHTTTTAYDSLNRPVSVTDANGNTTTTSYDAVGNSVAFTDGEDSTTSYVYDDLNRQVEAIDPLGHSTSYAYDTVGNRISMTDGNSIVTKYEYDGLNRLIAVVENYQPGVTADHETNVRTEYTYDHNGNRLTIKDGNGHISAFSYDALNRMTSEANPLGHTTSYSYDAVGNRVAMTDAEGFITNYIYDDANRLVTIDYPDPDADVTFSYDAAGNRIAMSDGVGNTSWTHDDLNRVTAVNDPFGDTVGYSYDSVGNRASLTYPDGKTVSYDYDPADRLVEVTDWDSLITSYSYDAADRVATVSLPNGVTSTYSYDLAGQLTELTHATATDLLSSFEYTYDPVGNRVQAIETLAGVEAGPTVTITVVDTAGTPLAGIPIFAFDGETYTGYTETTDASGQVAITLPEGDYRFRADVDGTQFWSGTADHCVIAGCTDVLMTIPEAVVVTVLDSDGNPQAGLPVYAFDGDTYSEFSGTTDAAGQVRLRLLEGDYRFRADFNGTEFWSGEVNHCSVPGCTLASVTVNLPVTVTVLDSVAMPKAGVSVYAFDGSAYTGFTGVTDEAGEFDFTLPPGDYRFRADFNGTQFWSNETNHCSVPGCSQATVTVSLPVTVSVVDTDGGPREGVKVYAFDGSTYTGYNATADANGEVQFTLPEGAYRFRADFNGTQFWSNDTNHCSVPGCVTAGVVTTNPVTVQVADTDGTVQEGLNVYAFDGSTYTGKSATTDGAGEVSFTLPQGDYRFRADLNGVKFWSGTTDHCAIPGCEQTSVTVTKPVTVVVEDHGGATQEGVNVYAFDGSSYTGYSKTSGAGGEAIFTLPAGSYRFRADFDGAQYWSGVENHCALPGCELVTLLVGPEPTVTPTASSTPTPGLTETPTPTPTPNVTPTPTMTLSPMATDTPAGTITPTPTTTPSPDATPTPTSEGTTTQTPTSTPTPTATSGASLNSIGVLARLRLHPVVAPENQGTSVAVSVLDTDGAAQEGVDVYAFDGSTYTGVHGVTDASGVTGLGLPDGSYRFRADIKGVQFWSSEANHCTVPDCTSVQVTVTKPVEVSVVDTDGVAIEGLSVYAFDGATYTGFSGTTDANGAVTFTLPVGEYRFRADRNGTQFWSGETNHCTLPGCETTSITVSKPVSVSVQDTDGLAQERLKVYAFDGTSYTGFNATTDSTGTVTFTLPFGDYRFRVDLNGTQFWSDEANHCTIPGCESTSVVVTKPVTVTVQDTDAVVSEGLKVYAFDGSEYTGFYGTTDANGAVTFTLPQGDYRFRADLDGTQFWSGETNNCAVPGCESAGLTVTKPVLVTVASELGDPYADLPVYVFDGENYTGFSGTSDANGQVPFTLPQGDYRFRSVYDGVQFWSGDLDHCEIPGCEAATVEIPGGTGSATTTIDYTYDPLYRLTAADYSSGEYFYYAYDAVGNRLTEDTHEESNSYIYDIANRLTSVNGVNYIWDDKGNLLSDGASVYEYDQANRLSTVTQGTDVFSFGYNGINDRISQTVNGEKWLYTLDIVAGLSKVLASHSKAYLYGLNRIGETESQGWAYYQTDGLGSVRQIVNHDAQVESLQSFEPFGSPRTQIDNYEISYGFAGEQNDATGLVYLRARYYRPMTGRFISPDPEAGAADKPATHNGWVYVLNNPVLFTDASGKCLDIDLDGTCDFPPNHTRNYSPPPRYVLSVGDPYYGPFNFEGERMSPDEYARRLRENDAYVSQDWSSGARNAVVLATWDVARSYSSAYNGIVRQYSRLLCPSDRFLFYHMNELRPTEAFLQLHGGRVEFVRTAESASQYFRGESRAWGVTLSARKILIFNNASGSDLTDKRFFVHELAHAFENALDDTIGRKAGREDLRDSDLWSRSGPGDLYGGFAGGRGTWQWSGEEGSEWRGEIFADQFVGWVYSEWARDEVTGELTRLGQKRGDYMNSNMPWWVFGAILNR